jgi:hypothetical protein
VSADTRRSLIASAIGVLSALVWIRFGLYGFGLPVGALTLLPIAIALALYVRAGRFTYAGSALTGFGVVWLLFELRRGLGAAFDDAVSIPDWSPLPIVAAVAVAVAGIALMVRSRRP